LPQNLKLASSRYLTRKYIYSSIESLKSHTPQLTNVLDVGCGDKPYRPLFKGTSYIGIDFNSNKSADVISDAAFLPVKSGTFNLVISTQTLMYMKNLSKTLNEFNRILSTGGFIIISAHGVWSERHEPGCNDLWRWTLDGLSEVLKESGFEIVATRSMNTYASMMQLCILYFPITPLIPLFNLFGIALEKVFPTKPGPRIYLDHSILARKVCEK
jgi:SAM-dependent methyltransferase